MADLKIEVWPIGNLIPFEGNSKKHPPEQVAKIAESIRRFNWDQPIVVDRHGVIIKGHGRRLGALHLGMTTVPVLVRKDLNPEQVAAARVADNRVAISDIDPELLRAELAALDKTLLDGIYDSKELDFLEADLGTMNTAIFVTDMAAVVQEQEQGVNDRMGNAKAARVPLAKAFGFKDLSSAGQLLVTRLMARAQAATGLAGEEAFMKWASAQIELEV